MRPRSGSRTRAIGFAVALERAAGLAQREPGDADEAADALHLRRLRPLRQQLVGVCVEPEHLELAAEELAAPAALEQVDVLEVRVDVGALQLAVERVDERLHLAHDAARERAGARLQLQLGALDHRAQVGDEPVRDAHDRDDAAGVELAPRLAARERRTMRTSLPARSIALLTAKVRSPIRIDGGSPASSTSATRGFVPAYAATSATSTATTSG